MPVCLSSVSCRPICSWRTGLVENEGAERVLWRSVWVSMSSEGFPLLLQRCCWRRKAKVQPSASRGGLVFPTQHFWGRELLIQMKSLYVWVGVLFVSMFTSARVKHHLKNTFYSEVRASITKSSCTGQACCHKCACLKRQLDSDSKEALCAFQDTTRHQEAN